MTGPSKTVCLRAFNQDLGGANPWERQGPTPPPLPKRIAWPGGKIVSNKDEALASFLRRKLDQGQALTPEQMTMLKKIVDPNAPATATAAVTASSAGKRQKRATGIGREHFSRGSGTDARTLLHCLERKVAGVPDLFQAGADSKMAGLASSCGQSRRKVDLSALKRGGMSEDRGAGLGGRRVVSDGQGGFTIATKISTLSSGVQVALGADDSTSKPPQRQQGTSNKRPRGFGDGRFEAAAERVGSRPEVDIPAVYREAKSFPNPGSGGTIGWKAGKVGGTGKKGFAQQQQKGRGKGGPAQKTRRISNISGLSGGGKGGGDRSLEEMLSQGLSGRR